MGKNVVIVEDFCISLSQNLSDVIEKINEDTEELSKAISKLDIIHFANKAYNFRSMEH